MIPFIGTVHEAHLFYVDKFRGEMSNRLPSAPPILSGFTYITPLGTGGFADVFLFEQQMPRRRVAVKVLLKNVIDEDLLRMFNAEADSMARLSSHPSIVTIFEASISADGRPYIIMEHCPGSYTGRYRREEIPVAEVLTLGVKVGSAIETAHRSGMLHRDIKPSNILVTEFGSPALADFGIATALASNSSDEFFAMSVPWSAPEIVQEKVSGSVPAEIWSLAATVYTLLAGRTPFERPGAGQNARELLKARIIKAHYTPIRRPDVPQRLEQVLAKALSKDPAKRHSSMLEFVQELQLVQHELGLALTPIEVTANTWEPAPISFDDSMHRGPIRSEVQVTSRRKKRPAAQTPGRPGDEGVTGRVDGAMTTGKLLAIVGGTVLATAAVVLGIIFLVSG